MAWEKYNISLTPKGYKTDISPDMLPSVTSGQWLTKGTQNVIIDDDGSTTSRKWTTLMGQSWGNWGVKWAQTWVTSTNTDRPMRSIFDTLQVLYENEWHDVATGFGNNVYFAGDSWWDRDQIMDRFVFCNKTTKLFTWQWGVTRVASRVSGTSLKKENWGTPTGKSVLIGVGDTITWGYPVDTQNPTKYNSLVWGAGIENFWEEGFRAGDTISVTIAAIAGTYTIQWVNPETNEIIITGDFASSGSSSAVGEWVVGTVNAYGPLAKTFAQERFPSSGTMNFTMLGVTYTYTGGFNTDTLTGISPALPAVIPAGTLIMSWLLEYTPTGGDYSTWATPDVIAISKNQLYLADSDKNWVWISNQDDFSDYVYTVPVRTNWEGWSARLDKNVVALVTNSIDNTVRASCGRDLWYPIGLESVTSDWVPWEEVRVGTPTRGIWVGAYNQTAICNTKEGILYLSKEPTFDYLQNIQQNNIVVSAVSEDIETDLQSMNLDRAKTAFWRNVVWLLLPDESKLYGYDMRRKMWQPPQIIAGESLSVIDEQLIVHSSIKNESYVMFSGTNDTGSPIAFRVVPNYTNAGTRERYKMLDGYYLEAKVTDATDEIQFIARIGYKGSKWVITDIFGSNDGAPFIEDPITVWGFWAHSIGQMPMWSLYTSDDEVNYKKLRRIFPFTKNWVEFFEMQVEFYCDKLDAQFKILAHGDNMELGTGRNSNLIKI